MSEALPDFSSSPLIQRMTASFSRCFGCLFLAGGMAPTTNLGRVTHGTRPQGVPEWVPPYPDLTGPVISANDVVNMTNSGKSTREIVDAVLNSRLDVLYADSPNAISRFRTAALTGSTFALFAEQVVAPEVLDALQATYIAQHVERSRNTGSRGTGGAANR